MPARARIFRAFTVSRSRMPNSLQRQNSSSEKGRPAAANIQDDVLSQPRRERPVLCASQPREKQETVRIIQASKNISVIFRKVIFLFFMATLYHMCRDVVMKVNNRSSIWK